jgi:hypothetical protein
MDGGRGEEVSGSPKGTGRTNLLILGQYEMNKTQFISDE